MITSLLKIGLLTLAYSVFPFRSTVAACSSFPLDQHAAIVKDDKRKNLSVGNVGYVGYVGIIDNYFDFPFAVDDGSSNIVYYADIKVDNSHNGVVGEFKSYSAIEFYIYSSNSLQINLFYGDIGTNDYDILYYNSYSGWDNFSQGILIKGDISRIECSRQGISDNQLIDYFNHCFTSNYVDFTFDSQINYNASYGLNINLSYFLQANYSSLWDLDNLVFLSNGRFYDSIIPTESNALNKSFLSFVDGDTSVSPYSIVTVNSDDYSYISNIRYHYYSYSLGTSGGAPIINKYNHFDIVNVRDVSPLENNGSTLDFVDNKSTWVSQGFRHIYIYNCSQADLNNISSYNDNNNNFSFIENQNSIGLGDTGTFGGNGLKDSFSLINMSITGIMGFLGTEILPNLTIGSLVLVPFAVSMLLFVITLFKR